MALTEPVTLIIIKEIEFELGKLLPHNWVVYLAIVSGAANPLIHGMLADTIGLRNTTMLPALCYMYIAYYGLIGNR